MKVTLFLIAGLTAGGANAQTPVERGAYLVDSLGGCDVCHTPRLQGRPDRTRRLSGGAQTFEASAYRVKGANITPDKATGIGAWSDDDLRRLLRSGVRPDGTQIASVMPVAFYGAMTDADVDAMIAYLRTIPAVSNAVPKPIYKERQTLVREPGADRPMTAADLANPVRRGFYLASIAHCMACHASRSDEPDFEHDWGGGGRLFQGPWGASVAANITSDETSGLGAWSDADIRRALTEGVAKDGARLKPPMLDYVAYYKTWSAADMDALIAWIRTIPAMR